MVIRRIGRLSGIFIIVLFVSLLNTQAYSYFSNYNYNSLPISFPIPTSTPSPTLTNYEYLSFDKVEKEIIDELERKEYVSVIVWLKPKMKVEDSLTYRESIRESQKRVLKNLDEKEFRVSHLYKMVYGFSGELNKDGLKKLMENNDVEFVYYDRILKPSLAQSVPLINADDVHRIQINGINIMGNGQTVCVMDTGIDYRHPDLGGCLGRNCKIVGGYDFIDNDNDPMDELGHGTRVAGVIVAKGGITGVAPDAKLAVLKVCDAQSNCPQSDIIAGTDWCVDNSRDFNIGVLSISIGGDTEYNDNNCPTGTMNDIINVAYNLNLPVIVASGNSEFRNGISYPACLPHVISVGAVYDADRSGRTICLNEDCTKECRDSPIRTDQIACYTDRGANLDLLAPGSVIKTTNLGGDYDFRDGTSMATPHVAGTIALMKQVNPNLKVDEILNILKTKGVPIRDSETGLTFSRIDALAAVNAARFNGKFIRGDANMDGVVDVSDSMKILLYKYSGGSLFCLDAADANDDGRVDISDPQYILNHLFKGGPRMPAPYPDFGEDTTADQIGC